MLHRVSVRTCLALALTTSLFAAQRCAGQDEDYTVLPIPKSVDVRREVVAADNGLDPDADEGSEDARLLKRKIAEINANRRVYQKTVMDILRGRGGSGDDFDFYFRDILFAEMTQTSEEDFAALPDRRQDFFKQYVYRSEGNVHKHLVEELAFPLMSRIVNNETFDGKPANYHPAVRYNAMLIISRLNEKEAVTRGNQQLPVAHAASRELMLKEFENDKQSDAVRVAALLGLLRHAKLEGQAPGRIPRDQKQAIQDAMVAVINSDPGNRSPAGHAWIQRRAMEVLGALGDPGAVDDATAPAGQIAALLSSIITDESARLSYRCTAAEAFGQLRLPAGGKYDAVKFADDLARLAVKGCQGELDFMSFELKRLADELNRPLAPGGLFGDESGAASPAGFPVGARRDAVSELNGYQLERARRAFKYVVDCVQVAVGEAEDQGVRQFVTDEPKKQYTKDLAKKLYDLYRATNVGMKGDEKEPTRALAKAVKNKLEALERTLAKSPSKPKAPPPKKEPDPLAPLPE